MKTAPLFTETIAFILLLELVSGLSFEKHELRRFDKGNLKGLTKKLLQALEYDTASSDTVGVRGEFSVNNSGCACVKYNCGCCAHLEIDKIGLNDTVCANFSYLPAELGISITLTIDNTTWINETISAKNPPPVCVGIPYLKKYASVCIQFKNLTIGNSSFSGCVYIEARLKFILVEELELGCFKIPPGDEHRESGMLPKSKKNEYLYFSPLTTHARSNKTGRRAKNNMGPRGYY